MATDNPLVIDEAALETACRAVSAQHYAQRFGKAVDDPHVRMNIEGNWTIFRRDAEIAIIAYLAAIGA